MMLNEALLDKQQQGGEGCRAQEITDITNDVFYEKRQER